MTAKECKNGCGRMIEWNNDLRYFQETATGQRHMCPNWKARQTSTFDDNKQKYGSGYTGPSNMDKMEKDLADLGVWKDGMELRMKELENEASRFIELSDALAKELKIKSFKTASDLHEDECGCNEEPIPDESTN